MTNLKVAISPKKSRFNSFESCFFYTLLNNKHGIVFWISACSILALPYILIIASYLLLDPKRASMIPIEFWCAMTFASSWFAFGPILVYRFIKSFIQLKSDDDLAPALRRWFKENEHRHYIIYKRCMTFLSPAFITLCVVTLLYRPEIMVKVAHITTGYNDPFFWIILAFLSLFLLYSSNSFSIIVLMIISIRQIKKQDVIMFVPINNTHYASVIKMNSYSNRIVSYMSSGMVFLPLAIFFIRQHLYVEWVSALLLFYGLFLLASMTYPRIVMRSYVEEKSKVFLVKEKMKYLSDIANDVHRCDKKIELSLQFYRYNSYLYLQELKTVCPMKMGADSSSIVTYLSTAVTIATSIPGFIDTIAKLSTP